MTAQEARSAADQLAQRVVDRLTAEGLLRPEEHEKLRILLVAGKATAADWRVAIESSQGTTDGGA